VVFAVGDALGDALVRPGRVVVHLVFGQHGAQMPLAEDQHAVPELAAQGADEALADRVHARNLDGGAQDPGAGGLEDRVERAGEVRPAIADEELDVLERSSRVRARLRACCTVHSPVGFAVTPPRCIRRLPCSMNTSILWNLACHEYPRLPCWGWMITIDGAAGSAFKQQRGEGGQMDTGPYARSPQ
jgi:hypothetical protein